ncbi:hypothetical protein POPTR_006G098800v4 [Populus trichocarpa]|uniref:Uncharacterized protein n=1 Tax=Populus trichocarpa TaxID=3694 RepID=A0ACC0STA5_POPTR|nr:hypothetical protein BDE02_06G087500 [Populus trichocarpa]KAI9392485.1 hypothetical protein POPTR_006G098800v4 [Populus trichocarpa]
MSSVSSNQEPQHSKLRRQLEGGKREKTNSENKMTSEITEEKDDDSPCFFNTEDERQRIRQIIEYQKSLYWSSSSPSLSSSTASCSSFSSSHKSSSLLDLMKVGSTSLRRLFDMEHTSLATHFQDYSGSPMIKPIPLWGSDTENEVHDPWASIRQIGAFSDPGSDEPSKFASGSCKNDDFASKDKKAKNRKLTRKKSFRRLPGFRVWRFRRFSFRLRLKRLRIMICGKIF